MRFNRITGWPELCKNILPFNKNTWGLNLESNYRAVKFQNESQYTKEWMEYQSIEISAGMKHYFFLNRNAKLYIDCYFNSILNPAMKSKTGYQLKTSFTPVEQNLNFKNEPHLSFGLGIDAWRMNIGVRYYTNNNILQKYPQWNADYKRWSLVIGYNLLKLRSK